MLRISVFFILTSCAFSSLCFAGAENSRAVPSEDRSSKLENFPCSSCHKTYSVEKLQLPLTKDHRTLVFRHMKDETKCLLCHSQEEPDKLVLLDGAKISLNQSPQLCGQCHGPVYLNWKEGIHGKRFGKGTPKNQKLLCASCHNPHSPKFKKMQADPPPHRPKLGVEKRE